MYGAKLVFSQIMDHLPWHTFQRSACDAMTATARSRHSSVPSSIGMAFAQLTYRESLRDIETSCVRNRRSCITWGSTASFAQHPGQCQSDPGLAQCRFRTAPHPYGRRLETKTMASIIDNTVYALDSSTIDLCLTMFPWAHFRKTKSAVSFTRCLICAARSRFPPHIRRQAPRRQRHGPAPARSRRLLHHGSRLSRLRPSLQLASGPQLLCPEGQVQHQPSSVLPWVDRASGLICDQTIRLAVSIVLRTTPTL